MSKLTRFGIAVALVIVAGAYAAGLASDPTLANHDVGWTVYAGGRILDGAEFGVDLIDNNPPLVYWTSAAVNAVARLVGAQAFMTYQLAVLVLILVCAALARRLLGEVVEATEIRDALAVAFFAALVVAPGYGFGQRDQMIAALLLPYVIGAGLAAAGRTISPGMRLAVGVAAGVALSLKPHYVLAWLAAEAVVVVRRRSLGAWSRLENWTMAAVGITYVTAVLVIAPAYLGTVRDTLAVYHAYDNPVGWLSPQAAILALALVVLAVARSRGRVGPRGVAETCASVAAAAATASFVAVLAQKKGFDYHYVPMLVASLAVVVLSLADRLELSGGESGERPGRSSRRRKLVLAAAACAALAAMAIAWMLRERYPERSEIVAAIEKHGEGRPVLFFSSSVDPLFPSLVFTGSSSASPYSCLWLIAGNYTLLERQGRPFPYRELGEMSDLERGFVTTIVDAVERQEPSILFFDRNVGKQAFGITDFEFERYFLAEPRFAGLLESYRLLGLYGSAMAYGRSEGRGGNSAGPASAGVPVHRDQRSARGKRDASEEPPLG